MKFNKSQYDIDNLRKLRLVEVVVDGALLQRCVQEAMDDFYTEESMRINCATCCGFFAKNEYRKLSLILAAQDRMIAAIKTAVADNRKWLRIAGRHPQIIELHDRLNAELESLACLLNCREKPLLLAQLEAAIAHVLNEIDYRYTYLLMSLRTEEDNLKLKEKSAYNDLNKARSGLPFDTVDYSASISITPLSGSDGHEISAIAELKLHEQRYRDFFDTNRARRREIDEDYSTGPLCPKSPASLTMLLAALKKEMVSEIELDDTPAVATSHGGAGLRAPLLV